MFPAENSQQLNLFAPLQMHASACESLLDHLKPGASVLDVGCGSGYLLGIFHELVSPGGKVLVRFPSFECP